MGDTILPTTNGYPGGTLESDCKKQEESSGVLVMFLFLDLGAGYTVISVDENSSSYSSLVCALFSIDVRLPKKKLESPLFIPLIHVSLKYWGKANPSASQNKAKRRLKSNLSPWSLISSLYL